MRKSEPHGRFELPFSIRRHTQGPMLLGRRAHFRIAPRIPESVEVEAPDIEARLAERITPGFSVKSVRDR